MCDGGQRRQGCAAPRRADLDGGAKRERRMAGRPKNGLLGEHAQTQGY